MDRSKRSSDSGDSGFFYKFDQSRKINQAFVATLFVFHFLIFGQKRCQIKKIYKNVIVKLIVCYQPPSLVGYLPHAVQRRDLPPPPCRRPRHPHQDLCLAHQVFHCNQITTGITSLSVISSASPLLTCSSSTSSLSPSSSS